MLEAVELPAGIAHLDSGLSDMNGNDLSHDDGFGIRTGTDRAWEIVAGAAVDGRNFLRLAENYIVQGRVRLLLLW